MAVLGPPLLRQVGRRYVTAWLSVPVVALNLASLQADTLSLVDWDQSLDYGGYDPFRSMGHAAASSTAVFSGRSDNAEVRWRSHDSGASGILRWSPTRRPVTDSIWGAFEAAIRPTFPTLLGEDVIDGMVRTMREASNGILPEFGPMMTDALGRLWLSEYESPYVGIGGAGHRYYVIESGGRYVGYVDFPSARDFRLLAVGTDRVLGVERDELDVESVVMYELVPGVP
jgi:hypothetical protein